LLPELLCDEKTESRLGETGLAEVRACLHAADCQTCGRPLGAGPPALVVDDVVTFAYASLHHRGCRAPGWNDGSVLTVTGGATVTWSARTVLMPATYGRRGQHPDPRPALIVNPGLESILLERRGGRWQPGHDAQLRAAGLVPPGRQLRLDRPVPGVTARAAGGDIAVTITGPLPVTYDAEADPPITARALELRGVLLIMTSAVNPGELTSRTGPAQIGGALTSPSTLAGWVALNPAP
jgi:hypothetical protein